MSSTVSDVQKIVVTLSEPDVVIEPGSVAKLVVTMANRQSTPDRLLVEVEGIDIEWYNIPVSAVNLAPGEQADERINFKVARNSENRAGSYPFVVRVKAMETGEVGEAQAMLMVKRFGSLQMEMEQRRALATFLRPLNDFELTLTNLGNAEERVELHASDPDDECAYEFDMDRIALKPGQSEMVPMAARPKVSSWIGGVKLYSFAVYARSADDSYVSAKALGQIERTALISSTLALILVIAGLASSLYFLFRPVPPVPIQKIVFTAYPGSIIQGQPITLSWSVVGDRPTFTLKHTDGKEGTEVFDRPPSGQSGNFSVVPQPATTPQKVYYTLSATNNAGKTLSKTQVIEVLPAPVVPKPQIRNFRGEPTLVHQGEQVTLTWKAIGQSYFLLDPGSIRLGQYDQSRLVIPDPPVLDQDVNYTLRAINDSTNLPPSEKTVRIRVVAKNVCIAAIDRFTVSTPRPYFNARIRLSWVARRARSITIVTDRGDTVGSDLHYSGSLSVPAIQKTVYTLQVTDNLGNMATKEVTVDPQVRPLPPPVDPVPPVTGAPVPPADGTTPPPATANGTDQVPSKP